jgi:hypothetical protein
MAGDEFPRNYSKVGEACRFGFGEGEEDLSAFDSVVSGKLDKAPENFNNVRTASHREDVFLVLAACVCMLWWRIG